MYVLCKYCHQSFKSFKLDYAFQRIAAWETMPNCQNELLSFFHPKLTEVPLIPAKCKQLLFHMCGFDELTGPLPPNLTLLVLRSCHNLQTISTSLPPTLQSLVIESCPQMNQLPDLPPTLEYLILNGSAIQYLPKRLPSALKNLQILDTQLQEMHDLPEGLEELHIGPLGLQSIDLPYLPDSLRYLKTTYHDVYDEDDPFDGYDSFEEMHAAKIARMNQMYEGTRSMARIKARTEVLKEDLMAAAWHPKRVARWAAAGDAVYDMMVGSAF